MDKALKLILIISISSSLFLHFPHEVYSQITISSNDLLDLIGKSHSVEWDMSGSVMVNTGSPGANQIWDFRSVSIEPIIVTWEFLSSRGTPFESDFPQSNFVWKMTFPEEMGLIFYTYCEVTSSSFSSLGNGIVTPDGTFKGSDFDGNVPLPFTFGTSWTTSEFDTSGDPQDYAEISITTTAHTADAWGTVLLPIGNFDCLRIRGDKIEISQTFISGFESSRDTTYSIDYDWFSKNNYAVLMAGSQDGDTNPNFTDASGFIRLSSTAVDVEDQAGNIKIPSNFVLFHNYPNPFNSQTIIQFELPQASTVSLNIYNLRGELIKSLSNEQRWGAGSHSLIWDGTDNQNRPVSSGVYLYQIRTDKFNQSKKCLFFK